MSELILRPRLALLIVANAAAGSIVDRSSFMRLRDQREPQEPVLDIAGDDEDHASAGSTDLHPAWADE